MIAFELSIASDDSNTASDVEACTIAAVMGQSQKTKRLGLMRLAALELLDKLQLCYGLRILEVFKEVDLFTSLLKMYALYPYNDIALRHVTSIFMYALDPKIAK